MKYKDIVRMLSIRYGRRFKYLAITPDDVSQEVLMKGDVDDETPEPLKLQIVKNRIIDFIRSISHRGKGNTHLTNMDFDYTFKTDDIDRDLINHLLVKLKPEQSKLLIERYLKERPMSELAIEMGVCEATAYAYLKEALDECRRLISCL